MKVGVPHGEINIQYSMSCTIFSHYLCKKLSPPNTFTIMEERKKVIPDFGYVVFVGERPQGLPKPKVVKCGTKNRNHAPIKVNRAIRTGVRVYQSGEPIDWSEAYN